MAHARTAKKAARRSAHSISTRQVAVASFANGKHTHKAAARENSCKRGQHAMHPERVREIQAALIREHYLEGRANGVWDQRSKNAMARFQSDHRWQSKVLPDSRALIRLGLGPDHAGLMNPETAAINFIPGGRTPISSSPLQP